MSLITFTANTPIKSADINSNFANLANGTLITAPYNMPYKFYVYRNGAWTGGTPAVVNFDTKVFDTGSNVDIVTNVGRFTAPVSGFYFFNATCTLGAPADGTGYIIYLNKNGSSIIQGWAGTTGAGPFNAAASVTALLQLTAGDYMEVSFYGSSVAGSTGATYTYFQGFLVSQV